MKVLVTGATGLLGSNVVRVLIEDGHSVVVLLRKISAEHPTLKGLDIEQYQGDICDPGSIEAAMNGVDCIIHTAAKTGLNPARSSEYWKANFEGTKNIVEVALKYRVKRLVHVGTANSFGSGGILSPGTELNGYDNHKFGFDYMDSKRKAQEYVLDAVQNRGLNAIIVNPTMMIGRYDSKPSSGRMIMAIYNKEIPAKTKGGRNYLAVKDAARATVNALQMGRVGECYILGGHNLSYSEAYDIMGDVVGVKPPRITLPNVLVRLFGILVSFFAKLFGFTPNITREIARISCEYDYYNSLKAQKELGLHVSSFKEAVKDCFDWIKENKIKPLDI